jgi:serine/threonine protein kinase
MRPQPRASLSRQWTVLPATVGLTEFHEGSHRSGSNSKRAGGASSTSVAPQRVGNYVLEARLGTGGMGDVYRARHSQFGRVRAVKIIKQHFVDAGHQEVIRRFYQEIKAVGGLEHPNIVVAIDSSSPGDTVHYLVMEHIDGIGADELVARHGPLPVPEACEIARQATRGLAYIHQHGMVHRDIKPSNLMLTLVPTDSVHGSGSFPNETGDLQAVVKILDLGLALLVSDDEQRLTLFDNRAMGTAMYMSPEQWRSTTVDIRADIYSLGCTLYHLLVGYPPFWESDLRPEKAHEREALPLPRSGPSLPPELWHVLEKMTAKKPQERYAEPAELLAALAPFAAGHHLAKLVQDAQRPTAKAATQGFAKGETMTARSAESDTKMSAATSGRGLVQPLPAASRSLWRAAGSLGLLAAVAAIGWLAIQAAGRRESLEASRQRLLLVAANSAANEIRNEIDLRFRLLQLVARDKSLQQSLVEIDARPGDEALWAPLADWLGARKIEGDQQAASESWFISDRQGTQVSRSPPGDSIGHNYAYRDYFNGQGRNFPPGTRDLPPIAAPHLSSVYKSTSDETLRVAFSVPIDNGRSGEARQVVGVLAMSVDLGEFTVLENVLDERLGQEVVLIDLRDDYLSGAPQRGLILHHRRSEQFGKDAPPQRLSGEMLARIDAVLAAQKPTGNQQRQNFLGEYADPLSTGSERKYWGAVERVILTQPSGERRDTGWLVLVQEPVSG